MIGSEININSNWKYHIGYINFIYIYNALVLYRSKRKGNNFWC